MSRSQETQMNRNVLCGCISAAATPVALFIHCMIPDTNITVCHTNLLCFIVYSHMKTGTRIVITTWRRNTGINIASCSKKAIQVRQAGHNIRLDATMILSSQELEESIHSPFCVPTVDCQPVVCSVFYSPSYDFDRMSS